MKKKLVVGLLVFGMCTSLAACGAANNQENNATVTEQIEQTEQNGQTEQTEQVGEEMTDINTEQSVTDDAAGNVSGDTAGQTLLGVFMEASNANADATAQELADTVLADPSIQFSGVTMEVEPGLLSGFGNAEITGFDEGVMFGPMIGSIPFVGYVFVVPEGEDVDAFMNTLKENADPRWNICTEADETVVESSGQKVFFLMCPSSFAEEL